MGFLRLYLALIVVVHHIPHYIKGNPSFPGLMASIDAMNSVLVFYIFSGFYMSLILNTKYSLNANYPATFYIGRILRIFPLYWIILFFTLIYSLAFDPNTNNVANIRGLSGLHFLFQIFMNVTTFGLDLVPSLGGSTFQLIGPAWSLGTELLFYIFAPFLVKLRARYTVAIVIVSFAIRTYLLYIGQDRYPFRVLFFPLSLGFFLLGHLSFLWLENLKRGASRIWKKMSSVNGAGLAIAFLFLVGWQLKIGSGIDPDTSNLHIFYFLLALTIPVIFEGTKRIKIDKFLGDLTFPLYISHALVLRIIAQKSSGGNEFIKWSALGSAFGIAVILTLAIERPLEKWRGHLLGRLFGHEFKWYSPKFWLPALRFR